MTYLISACLLGEAVRYDGGHCAHDALNGAVQNGSAVGFCPEMAGGLPVPRAAAEIVGGDGADVLAGRARVLDCHGKDVSAEFVRGAQAAWEVAQQHGVSRAILKANSPSCGKGQVYDGSFSGSKTVGNGVTAALLLQHGIDVFCENELPHDLNN